MTILCPVKLLRTFNTQNYFEFPQNQLPILSLCKAAAHIVTSTRELIYIERTPDESVDLNPQYFLQWYPKDKIYKQKPQNEEHLLL